jgi:hypothetical protein
LPDGTRLLGAPCASPTQLHSARGARNAAGQPAVRHCLCHLARGTTVLTSIVDADFAQLAIGATVEVVLKEVAEGVFFPFFRLKPT